MPDPISSSGSLRSESPSYDPYADDAGLVSRADAPNSSQAQPGAASSQPEATTSSPAVPKLVSSVPPSPSVLPPAAPPSPRSSANNNAERTNERLGVAAYMDAGKTAAGDSVYVGVALLKGRDPSGAAVEVMSASVQVGAQTEVQVGLQRVAGQMGALSGSVETFTLRANAGVHNDDGSVGLNLGASATAVGFEGTAGGASSVTYGVAAGVGAGASVGVRDIDRDGKTELCARFSFGPVTAGACMENPL
ncbi:MAG: hypothetical protein EOO73_26515 [Myxococcales bacterium]|nr:MAG: hypothetical protein EOO73_26515 [Myxococcales bacterium]